MAIDGELSNCKVLAVDDDPEQLYTLVELLESAGFSVIQSQNGQAALSAAERDRPDLILMDVNMPVLDGLEATRQLKADDSDLKAIPVVLLTSQDSPEDIREGLEVGANDYISKPFKRVELLGRIKAALKNGELYRELTRLRTATRGGDDPLVAQSAKMSEVLRTVERAERSEIPILLTGETGTGKELLARRIHSRSKRSTGPFFAVNCALFQQDLLRSELFGHVKGAFTGAVSDRRGLFASSSGGTLLLDEIGEMELDLQAQLLRVLEDGSYQPLGTARIEHCDVRIIAATHRNLEEMVSSGLFREDLFYRINMMEISLPPLRERREDIRALAEHFLERAKSELQLISPREISQEILELLVSYDWPGNIRQLKNEVFRMVALSDDEDYISVSSLSKKVRAGSRQRDLDQKEGDTPTGTIASSARITLKEAVGSLEAELIKQALSECAGNKSEAARILDISRSSLIAKIKSYDL